MPILAIFRRKKAAGVISSFAKCAAWRREARHIKVNRSVIHIGSHSLYRCRLATEFHTTYRSIKCATLFAGTEIVARPHRFLQTASGTCCPASRRRTSRFDLRCFIIIYALFSSRAASCSADCRFLYSVILRRSRGRPGQASGIACSS